MGFRPHYFKPTALLKLAEHIHIDVDQEHLTLLLLFDFSEAFDTVSRTHMLLRLKQLGLTKVALLRIDAYLSSIRT